MSIAKDFQVRLSSEDYGEEVFNYDTEHDALTGYARLLKSCRKEMKQDGIERHLECLVVLEQECIESEWTPEQQEEMNP